jgi:transposase InsO family protein
MDEKMKFIVAVNESDESVAQLCRRFGISRKTGYKWIDRYETYGPAGLEDRAPIPYRCPHQTPIVVVDAVLDVRRAHPTWGPKKVRAWLEAKGSYESLPAVSTIAQLLGSHGLIRPRRRRIRTPPGVTPLVAGGEPNELWCVDFKGQFTLGDKTRCYPLTITDHVSRYLLRCEGLTSTKEAPARAQFERTFREFGLPDRIRSDNGVPFASVGVGGLSALSVWWIQLGITPERIEPGHPEQNGRHERMHKTLKLETAISPQHALADQQRAFDRFRHEYNDERPHEALAMKTPASRYAVSRRVMPDRPRAPEYPEGTIVRIVDDAGRLKHRGGNVMLTRLLAHQPVGLRECGEDRWRAYYGPVVLGEVQWRNQQLRLDRVTTSGADGGAPQR